MCYQIQPGCHLPWKRKKNQSWKLQRDMGEAITVLSHVGMYQHMPGSLVLSCLPWWSGRTILILKDYLSLQREMEWSGLSPGIRVVSKWQLNYYSPRDQGSFTGYSKERKKHVQTLAVGSRCVDSTFWPTDLIPLGAVLGGRAIILHFIDLHTAT